MYNFLVNAGTSFSKATKSATSDYLAEKAMQTQTESQIHIQQM